jgi:hypothetical protein
MESHAEGYNTEASSDGSHAEGQWSTASGDSSHAEGYNTTASGFGSHAEGFEAEASGENSHAEGYCTTASGDYSHAEGYNTKACAPYGTSHAEGEQTIACGPRSHAEGCGNTNGSMTITGAGYDTEYTLNPSGYYYNLKGKVLNYGDNYAVIEKFDEDNLTITLNKSLSEEALENASVSVVTGIALGEGSHSEGRYTVATYYGSHAEGGETAATGEYAHAEGWGSKAMGGYGSHAEGYHTIASYDAAHAEGFDTDATAKAAHAEGYYTEASGYASHAEGNYTTASGENSHAEGWDTTASGRNSHAEGINTTASEYASHAEGNYTIASGNSSHAEGQDTTASGYASHAEGSYTTASSGYQHVQGKSNIEDTEGKYAHIVGNGTAYNKRSNAHTLDWNGNAWFAGDVYIGGTGQDDSNSASVITEKSINSPRNYFSLIDLDNGYTYIVQMKNGNLVTRRTVSSIKVTTMPNKIEYYLGEYFDPTGMVVTATCEDGSIIDVTNYISDNRFVVNGNTVTILYDEAGNTYTTTITVNVIEFDAATILIDFEYIANDDGTYTITAWKGTKNGVASTEMVVPDISNIIL